MSPFLLLMEIRKGQTFCRGGNLFEVALRGTLNNDVWAETYFKPQVTSSCGPTTDHEILPNHPRQTLALGTFHKVSITYEPGANLFELNLGGARHTGPTLAAAVLQAVAGSPLYLVFSLERALECFDSSGNTSTSAECCHRPSTGWQYRAISYEICP